jgi:hypothetical protein
MYGHRSYLKIYGGLNRGLSGKLADYLTLAGVEGYELFYCDYQFYQRIDSKGKAETEVRGGEIRVVLDTLPTQELIEWALISSKRHSGEIGLCSPDSSEGVIERLVFEDAYCTVLNLSYTEDTSSFIKTMLVITAPYLTLGYEKLDKRWTNNEW